MTLFPGAVGITELRVYPWETRGGDPSPDRARARRDLAIAGFRELRAATDRGDPGPLRAFHATARRLVADRLDAWRARWASTARRAADRTGEHLDALGAGNHDHLADARIARIPRPATETLGMCGYLTRYETGYRPRGAD